MLLDDLVTKKPSRFEAFLQTRKKVRVTKSGRSAVLHGDTRRLHVLAATPGEAVYVPLGHTGLDAQGQIPKEKAWAELKPLLADPKIRKLGQNIQYDWVVLKRHDIEFRGLEGDTMLAAYLLRPDRRTHGRAGYPG